MPNVIGFDHLVLLVADVERSVAWYADELGLQPERLQEWRDQKVFFPSVRISPTALIDIIPGGAEAGRNVDHFCLVVSDDVAELAASGRFDVVDGPDGHALGAQGDATSLYVRDPDGNVVELPQVLMVLAGESIIGLARCPTPLGSMPPGVHRMPGPVLVAAVRYSDSDVGPYLELAIGEPARLGVRLGWCMTTMVVDSPASRAEGRTTHGFPKEVGSLAWDRDGEERELRWSERQIVVRGVPSALRLPVLVPVRALQRREDGPVVVPGRLRGVARLARVEVATPEDDPLWPLAGAHRGCTVAGMRFRIGHARTPFGIASTLRAAPLRPPPEPALSSAFPLGAYSSVG